MRGLGYPPKISGGKVFVSFLEGRLAAFEEGTAKQLWDYRLPQSYRCEVPHDGELLVSDNLLITRLGEEMLLLNATTGKLKHRHAVPNFNLRSAVLLQDRVFGIFVDEDDDDASVYCFAYDLQRRQILWKYRLDRISKCLTMSDQRIFLSDKKGYFTCLAADTGTQLWTTSLMELGRYTETDKSIRSGDATGVPFLWEELVIVPVEGYHVAGLDQTSGAIRWSQSVDIDDPRNVVCSSDGIVTVFDSEVYDTIDAATGQVLSRTNIAATLRAFDDPFLTQMDVSERFLYFSIINKGILAALERQSGKILWTFQCSSGIPVVNAPILVNERLYLLDEDHNLYVFAA